MATIIEMPSLSSTMRKGKVVRWHKGEGDFVQKGETLFEVQTDKVNVEVDALVSGFLRRILLKEGIEAPVKTPIAIICDSREEDISSILRERDLVSVPPAEEALDEKVPSVPKPPGQRPEGEGRIRISPLARRMAEEVGIDTRTLRGTGPEGRITKQDIERAVAERSQRETLSARAEEEPAWQVKLGETSEIELTPMRKIMAQRLQQSKVTAPHFYVEMTADATALQQSRKDLQRRMEGKDIKITFNDILIKIVSHALGEFPMVNASFLGDRIRLHKAVHMGVAVAIDEGLVVPVVRDANQKSISQISREVAELAAKARNKRLLPSEYEGGTFTITNMGMFGVESFHAIINPPESAILAVGAITAKPVVVDGEICVRPCMKLCLSADHRVVDGALAARFLARVKDLTEAPLLMLA